MMPIEINLDGTATKKVIFKDVLPANVSLLNDRDPLNTLKATEYSSHKGVVLYHVIGDAEHTYHITKRLSSILLKLMRLRLPMIRFLSPRRTQ